MHIVSWRAATFVALLLCCCRATPAASLPPLLDVAQIGAGKLHNCIVTRAGGVACWGDNSAGQLGLGDAAGIVPRLTAVPVPGLAGIRDVASGYSHTCAVGTDGSVHCWGLNFAGQSGDDRLEYQHPTPAPVAGLPTAVRSVATGEAHSCALHENGDVSCWGDDGGGQLGDGQPGGVRAVAARVDLGGAARALAAGSNHTCAALAAGGVRCWGRNEQGQLGDGTLTDRALPVEVQGISGGVRALALGAASSCALGDPGGLSCWGPQYPLAAFGGGSLVARSYPGFESNVVAVVAGIFHYCAQFADGAVRCFGENAFGQFGTGPIDGSLGVDAAVDLAPTTVEIEAGGSHTCARSAAGGLQCWGDNGKGQLGIDETSLRLVPTQVVGLEQGVAMVGSGAYHGCALTTAGAVKCWGANPMVGDGTNRLRLTPVDVPGLASGVRVLETGVRANCVITAQRRAKCWGVNFAGQLGVGRASDSELPGDVMGLGDVDVLALGVGRDHACALLAGGAVKCWGSNEYGQIGDGSITQRFSAVDVIGLGSGVRALSVGWLHGCAITDAGALRCWGYNTDGQLGDDSTTHRSTPVAVVGLTGGVTGVAAGGVHTCATLAGGLLRCWGDLAGGTALGDGSSSGRRVPGTGTTIAAGVTAASAALFDSCAIVDGGALRCWGGNDGGDIGDNTTLTRRTPVDVPGLNRGVTHVDGSYGNGGHACAVVDGAAKCWGENIFAQLGDGTTHGVPTAQTVVANELARRVTVLDADANAASRAAQVDASGRYVVFESDADNLVPGDTNGATDVFRLDRENGEVVRASVDTAGSQLAGASTQASVSADGRHVVFVAPDVAAKRLAGESGAQRARRLQGTSFAVMLRNLVTGTTQRLGTAQASGSQPRIAANSGAVAFVGAPGNAGEGTPGQGNVFVVPLVRDGDALVAGAPRCMSCKSIGADGSTGSGNADGASAFPVLSADGQWLAYQSAAANALASDPSPCPSGNAQLLLQSVVTGIAQRISPPPSFAASACSQAGNQRPSIDHAGRTIAFQSDQALDGDDANGVDDVYVWRVDAPQLLRVSRGGDGADTAAPAQAPQVSGDGKQVVFVSAASNLDTDSPDDNERSDLHGVALDDPETVRRLSRTVDGGEANAASFAPALNYDGSQLAFHSDASNLTRATAARAAVIARGNPLSPPRKSATWWVPEESGWGLTVFDQGNLLAPTWFTYDSDGEPTWFIVGGALPQADGGFRGDLLRLTGEPFDRIVGDATLTADTVGSVTLTYAGADRLRFDYRVDGIEQFKTLERFPFGTRDFTCSANPSADRGSASNYTDLWTGVDGGWGLTLFHVDEQVVAIWYTYDLDGEAVFFVITTTRQADGSYAGQIFRQRNGTPFSAIDGNPPSADADAVGTATFRFTDGDSAEFAYVLGSVSQSRAITRLLVGDAAQVCRSTDAD